MAGPLEQFTIKPIISIQFGAIDLSFTNSALWMLIAVGCICLLMLTGASRRKMVPGRLQTATELLYEFIANMIHDTAGSAGRAYFPFIFSLFMFILMGNMLGLLPAFSFTYTSHIIVTFGMAMAVFIGVTVIGLIKHRLRFFTLFFPAGAPIFMAPLLIPIEILSYLSRPISLSVRLFANMMAGHVMLKVFAGFAVTLGVLGGIVPGALLIALTGFELLVAVLQAYVFTILTCIYLNDALHLH